MILNIEVNSSSPLPLSFLTLELINFLTHKDEVWRTRKLVAAEAMTEFRYIKRRPGAETMYSLSTRLGKRLMTSNTVLTLLRVRPTKFSTFP